MINKKQQGKLYKPVDVRNPYFVVPFLLFIAGYCSYDLFYQFYEGNQNIFIILFFAVVISFCGYLVYIHFANCVYIEMDEKSMICKNHFKMTMAVINFDEIEELVSSSHLWYNVKLKNIHGKIVILNTATKPTDEFFNEIITRAVNCKIIDLQNIKKAAPGLILYEKGIGRKD